MTSTLLELRAGCLLALTLVALACTPQPANTGEPTGEPAPSTERAEPEPSPPASTPDDDIAVPEWPLPDRMNDMDFGLDDDDYWSDPTKTRNTVIKQLWKRGGDGVAIGAPSFAALQGRETLPLVVYRGASYRDLWAMSLLEYAQVVAVDLERNQVWVGPVVADDEADFGDRRDPAKAPKGNGSESAIADLRADLGLPWQPSTYVLTVLMREHASNRVRVALGDQAGAFHDEEVERFLAAHRDQAPTPVVSPKPRDPVPRYDAMDGSPAVPETAGIALASDRVVVSRPGARSILRGAFRVPVAPPQAGVADPVVGVTLVVNASDQPQSGVLRLDVPAKLDGDLATGYFAIDLIAEGLAREPQTYFVYAFSSEVMAGPTPAALVAESRL